TRKSPRGIVGRTARRLPEELLDVAGRDRDRAELAAAEDLERDRLARTMRPEEPVERAAIAHLLPPHGEDHVAGLEPRLLAGPARKEARDHDVLLHGVAEDAEPGARPGEVPAAADERIARVQEAIGRDREREAADLVQVERHDAEDAAERVEQRAA